MTDVRRDFCAVDYGTIYNTRVCGPGGIISLRREPSLKRIFRESSLETLFPNIIGELLLRWNVVLESPTIGSSGVEKRHMIDIVRQREGTGHLIYCISARAVKNYCMDFDVDYSSSDHELAARIIYKIAVDQPCRLKVWNPQSEMIDRKWTSVRPMDYNEYRDSVSNELMKNVPPFSHMPLRLQRSPMGKKGDYRRRLVIPLIMATQEPWFLEHPTRERFEKIIGMYEHGYPSFYRRCCVEWMKENAASMDRGVRKEAMIKTTRQIREFFHCTVGWQKMGMDYEYMGEKIFREMKREPRDVPPPPIALR